MKLLHFIHTLSPDEQETFAELCRTSLGYMRQVAYGNRNCGPTLAINIERESHQQVTCEELCPEDVDWAYIRSSSGPQKQNGHQGASNTETAFPQTNPPQEMTMDVSNGSTAGVPPPKFERLSELLSAKKGGTMFDLAFYCGVKPQIVLQWFAGEKTPSRTRIRKIARYLGIPVADVLRALPGIESVPASQPTTPARIAAFISDDASSDFIGSYKLHMGAEVLIESGVASDYASMCAAQLASLLRLTYGAGGPTFRNLGPGYQDNILWLAACLADELRDLIPLVAEDARQAAQGGAK